jgi:hypothetical protein
MVGAGDDILYVDSVWYEPDGFRKWSVHWKHELKMYLTVPDAMTVTDVLIYASYIAERAWE